MSEENTPAAPPSAPPPDVPAPPPQPFSVSFNRDEVNYFLHVIDFHREMVKEVLQKVPPLDLVTILGFIQGAIEAQIPQAAGAFNEQREFFRIIYPAILAGHFMDHPEEQPAGDDTNIFMIVPKPANGVGFCELPDGPRIIHPGSSLVQ